MANMNFGVNIMPKVDNTYALGNSSKKWQGYFSYINGTLADNALLPIVTTDDNNKVLKVVSGSWTTADAPTGLPAVTVQDEGKILTVSSGAVWVAALPPASPVGMTGATSSANGTAGYVPAPLIADRDKFLKGDGTWDNVGSSGVISVTTTVTNSSGAYTTTINDARINATMEAISLELGTPTAFKDSISISTGDGYVTLSCNSVEGTSTVKIRFIASILSSSEFTSLNANKADKVANATSGNFAALDVNGNLVDSGVNSINYDLGLTVVNGKLCVKHYVEVEE